MQLFGRIFTTGLKIATLLLFYFRKKVKSLEFPFPQKYTRLARALEVSGSWSILLLQLDLLLLLLLLLLVVMVIGGGG